MCLLSFFLPPAGCFLWWQSHEIEPCTAWLCLALALAGLGGWAGIGGSIFF
jgi:hypothetical protein